MGKVDKSVRKECSRWAKNVIRASSEEMAWHLGKTESKPGCLTSEEETNSNK